MEAQGASISGALQSDDASSVTLEAVQKQPQLSCARVLLDATRMRHFSLNDTVVEVCFPQSRGSGVFQHY